MSTADIITLDNIKADNLCDACRAVPVREVDGVPSEDGMCDKCHLRAFREDMRAQGYLNSIDDLANIPCSTPFIRGRLNKLEVTVLAGAPTTWKSFLALDWALSIASGRQWQGLDTKKAPVLYVTNEGVGGLHRRIQAWENGWQQSRPADFWQFTPPTPLWDPQRRVPDLSAVVMTARSVGAELIVFDTMSSLFGGIGENGADDISVVTNRLTAIRNNYGIASLVIHHTTKANPEESRGSGALKGNVDALFVMTRAGSVATLKTAKVKDGADWSMMLTSDYVVVGVDDDGYEVGSLILSQFRESDINKDPDLRSRVLDVLPPAPERMSAKDIAEELGAHKSSVQKVCRRLVEEELIVSKEVGRGVSYSLPASDD